MDINTLTLNNYLGLVNKGLATVSINDELSTFKYHRKVMYENLWSTEPLLLECRGITFNNQTGELVALPFRKSFNYLENGNWKDISLDSKVILFPKINGFMACATLYNKDILMSTTGSTKSPYAELAKKLFKEYHDGSLMYFNKSYLFEIVDKSDPHIINEEEGVHFLGSRNLETGNFTPNTRNSIYCSLDEALRLQKEDRCEGYMMYLENDLDWLNPCKLKTDYYTGKKKLMRMPKNKVHEMYKDMSSLSRVQNSLPNLYKDIPLYIIHRYTMQEWIDLPEQDRRVFIESFVDYV